MKNLLMLCMKILWKILFPFRRNVLNVVERESFNLITKIEIDQSKRKAEKFSVREIVIDLLFWLSSETNKTNNYHQEK